MNSIGKGHDSYVFYRLVGVFNVSHISVVMLYFSLTYSWFWQCPTLSFSSILVLIVALQFLVAIGVPATVRRLELTKLE